MAKYGSSKDRLKYEIIKEEFDRVSHLIKGHLKLLTAIGRL
ncbi:MAG: hypothetical protein AABY07_01535 [Nanoarchaeota archaeon]